MAVGLDWFGCSGIGVGLYLYRWLAYVLFVDRSRSHSGSHWHVARNARPSRMGVLHVPHVCQNVALAIGRITSLAGPVISRCQLEGIADREIRATTVFQKAHHYDGYKYV